MRNVLSSENNHKNCPRRSFAGSVLGFVVIFLSFPKLLLLPEQFMNFS